MVANAARASVTNSFFLPAGIYIEILNTMEYTQRLQKLIDLHLSTDYVMKISLPFIRTTSEGKSS